MSGLPTLEAFGTAATFAFVALLVNIHAIASTLVPRLTLALVLGELALTLELAFATFCKLAFASFALPLPFGRL